MALKSPTPIHNFWGTFANATSLPNASGYALSPLVLEAGDVAYVGTPADTLYVCTSPGTAGGGNAVWVALATGTVAPVAIASERWVTTGGNDLTGDGSLSAPYATVGAALASITTAAPTSRWAVRVAAGAFTEAAPLLLKPNVYIIGEDRNATRLTAPSVALDATFSAGGGVDNRAGFANLTLIGAATFDFAAVTSSAGKLYANGVNFNSAVAFNGYSAINQTIFFDCYFFGTFTTSGVNHGAHVSCVHSALAINQHPSLPSILNAIGGTSGAATFTTTVNDFARRVSVFAKNFWMEPVTIDGPSTYLDTTVSSLPSAGSTIANGANLVWLDQGANRKLSNLQGPTSVNESLVPDLDSSRYLGDFGKQWLFTFNYVLTSTGTDLYIITTPSTFGSSAVGHAIYIQPDSYGLDAGTNGGNVEIETVPATGGGNSGSVVLKTGTAASPGVRGDLTIDVNEVNLALIGALNVNTNPGAAGQVLTSQGAGLPPVWDAGGGASLALSAVRVATATALPANSYSAGVLTADVGGSINAVGIDGVTTLAVSDRVLVKNEPAGLKNQIYQITDLGSPASGPATPSVPAPPVFFGALLTCGSGGTYATLTAAVAAAAPGDRIEILPGTIVEAAAVAVNKSLEIFGTGATCVVQRNSTTAVIAVTASNVYLHNFKIVNNQLASADPGGQSACVGADTMNRTSLGGATGLYFANLTCEMPKVGVFVSGTSWVVRDCAFAPSVANATAGTTLRAVFVYGSEGTSFINNNTVLTPLDNARMTAIYLNTRNDGVAPNWEGGYKGSLIIDGNVINDGGGSPRSYIDATSIYHQSGTATTAPPAGEFSLYIVNNDFSLDHGSSPCVFFGRAYGATPVAPLSFFLDLVVSDNLFGAREASASQKGALFWTNTSGGAVSMGALVGGFYGANNVIDPMTLPATNTSIMADASLLMVRENAFYNAPSPLLTLVPLNPGAPWSMTVAADFASVAARGAFSSVNEGTQNATTSWIVITADPITLGTTSLTWDLFGDALTVQDEGSATVTQTKALNFVGAGVTVTNAGNGIATVTVSGGAGPSAAQEGLYYVSAGGSDITGNGTILAPFASITAAITAIGTPATPVSVVVGPGSFGSAVTPIVVPTNVTIEGSRNTTIVASGITLNNNTSIFNTTVDASSITVNPSAVTRIQNVQYSGPSTNITNTSATIYATNVTAVGGVTYNGGTVIEQSNNYLSSLTVNNANYTAIANAHLSISIDNSTADITASAVGSLSSTSGSATTVNSSEVSGAIVTSGGSLTLANVSGASLSSTTSVVNVSGSAISGAVSVDGGALTVGGSTLSGTLTGINSATVVTSLDSYPQGGLTTSSGATESNSTTVPQNIAAFGTATGGANALIATIYFPQAKTLTQSSLAFIGGALVSDVTVLTLAPAGGGSPVATWTQSGTLGQAALPGPTASIPQGWYDIILDPGASGTAFVRGLYLV